MRKLTVLMLSIAFSLGQLLAQQSKTITGKVTDDKGNPIANASITVKGFKGGTTAGQDGTFSFEITSSARTIIVSAVGYENINVNVINKENLIIVLKAEGKDIGSVIATGYKTIKRKDATASITTINGDIFQNKSIQSFDQALAGKAAGLNANITGGLLGDAVNIRIRGVNSISGSAQPLIVVDGVPINQNTNVSVFNSGNGTRYNPLTDINPNDIESIDILKDAAASALYGSRGANGVLVITTKRGKAGAVTVSYNSYFSASSPTRLPKLLNGDNFEVIQNEKASNAHITTPVSQDIDLNGDGKPDRTNWLDQVFRTGISQNHQISLSGGTDKAKFYGSVEYTDQKGIIVGNRLRRGAARINLDLTPKKWFKSGISVSYSKTQSNGILSDRFLDGVTVAAYNAFPNIPIYDPNATNTNKFYLESDGTLGHGNNDGNQFSQQPSHPLGPITLNRNDNNINRLIGSVYGEVEPIKGLKLTSKFAVDYLQNFEDQYSSPEISGLGFNDPASGYNGLVQENFLMDNIWNWSNYASYTKTISDHTFNITGGLEYHYFKEQQIYVGQGNLSDPYFKYIYDGLYSSDLAGSSTTFSGGTAFANAFDSYFGTFSYNYKNKYFADGVLRADAYSGFGVNKRRGYFPGGSIGWRISSEDFMKEITAINDLKLRISYGKVGNANVGSYASKTLYGGGQYADVNGLSISQVGDPNLHWESSNKFDIGIDATLLKNRLSVIIDYFHNNITDLALQAPPLLTVGIPGTSPGAIGTITTNIGSMVNRGFELTINSTNIINNNFNWRTSFNITFVKNKVTKLVDPNTPIISGNNRAFVGQPLGVFYLVRWAGVDPATGQAMFLDKDDKIRRYNPDPAVPAKNRWTFMDGTTADPISASDGKYLDKSGYPTVFGGLDNVFSYKDFDFGIFLQYSLGNYIYNSTRAGLMTNNFNNNINEILTRWTKPGDITNVQKLYIRDATSNQASTRWLEKGDFLRIREINVGYNFRDLSKRLNINSLRVFASIQNAFIFTKYSGQDPEITTNRQNDPNTIANIANGIDNRGVPLSRTINFGVNVGF